MIGAPGSGKSMMAKCLPSILPPLTLAESLETTKIHSVAGKLGKDSSLIAVRPFRSPHHTISQVAMVGGGSSPQPGEISLAHNGVLFLDELPEFNRSVLEVLRQPLEDRRITISRSKYTLEYPASFTLIASMNPCPCGYYNHPTRHCVCSPGQVQRYLNKISGPLLDRIDIQIEIVPVPFENCLNRLKVNQVQLYANELSGQDRYKPADLLMTQESTATHKCHHVCYTNMHFQTKRALITSQCHGAFPSFSTCLRPHSESIKNYCRPGKCRTHTASSFGRSHQLPQP